MRTKRAQQKPSKHIRIPAFKDCDFAIPVYRYSIKPIISTGDVILCKTNNDKSFFNFGEIYLIVTDEQRMVKFIKKTKKGENGLLNSQNEDYDDITLPVDKIVKLYVLRNHKKKSMKVLFTIVAILLAQAVNGQYLDTIYYQGIARAVTITSITETLIIYKDDSYHEQNITNEDSEEDWIRGIPINKSVVDSVYLHNAQSPYTLNREDAHFGKRLQDVGYLMISAAVFTTLGALIPELAIAAALVVVVINVAAVVELIKAGKNAVLIENQKNGSHIIVF